MTGKGTAVPKQLACDHAPKTGIVGPLKLGLLPRRHVVDALKVIARGEKPG
jgi:hypothetical protein